MSFTALFSFEQGDAVPLWVYTVKDAAAPGPEPCTFGVPGKLGLLADGSLAIWPGKDRDPKAYIFQVGGGFLYNATAGHPAGRQLLKVFASETEAEMEYGDSVNAPAVILPVSDPRQG